VNFNGTGTVAIRAAGNVSSVTDNGVGIYTANFTTAMPDANYSVNYTIGWASDPTSAENDATPFARVVSSSAVRLTTMGSPDYYQDPLHNYLSVFR
jgi:hypothetical protein